MFIIEQFRNYILKPSLSLLQLYSDDAEELLVFTCAVESDGGALFKQVGGPALGIFQCEPNTHNDLWRNFIFNEHKLISLLALNFACPKIPDVNRLIYDLNYATAIARLHYYRIKSPLPKADDIDAIYDYYKQYYNTPAGKSTKTKSIAAYKRFTGLS